MPQTETSVPSHESANARRDEISRLLVIRFSSFGDIVQACAVPAAVKSRWPACEIDWLVRDDFASLLEDHPHLHEIYAFPRSAGLKGLLYLAWKLAGSGYTHVYDAHSNVRSRLVCATFRLRHLWGGGPRILRRSKERLRRWLFFRFRLPTLPQPYRGTLSFLKPLTKWGLSGDLQPGPQFFSETELPKAVRSELETLPRPWIACAPSAAWEMKRWPLENWLQLIERLQGARAFSLLILGGPEDRFVEPLARLAAPNAINLAGRLTLSESSALLKEADLVIANDTGLLHVADQLERPTIALIGPTAFGYPSHRASRTAEISLPCKPCSKDGRGRCVNSLYQRCLVQLMPDTVARMALDLLSGGKG